MDTSDESPEVLEASGVVLPVAAAAFADTARYLVDNNLLADFEAHLGKIGLSDIGSTSPMRSGIFSMTARRRMPPPATSCDANAKAGRARNSPRRRSGRSQSRRPRDRSGDAGLCGYPAADGPGRPVLRRSHGAHQKARPDEVNGSRWTPWQPHRYCSHIFSFHRQSWPCCGFARCTWQSRRRCG